MAASITSNRQAAGQSGPNTAGESAAPPEWQRKDTFVATLAHELRQPLSAMLAAMAVARRAPGSDAARRADDVMQRQLGQMGRLLEDLVDATRWARGQVSLDKQPLDLRDIMRDAAADAACAVADAGQQLAIIDARESVWISGDRQRLLQGVSHLLRNAVKYTPRGGRITLAIERMAWTVTLRVADSGCGIEADALPHVFDLFSQAHPEADPGLGIGLAVAREIVLRHGGSIDARSEGVGHGSEFLVRLPLTGLSPWSAA
jgi:signal transduction histidine kinase